MVHQPQILIIPLVVLDTEVTITGINGSRKMLMKDVITKPYTTCLANDEIV